MSLCKIFDAQKCTGFMQFPHILKLIFPILAAQLNFVQITKMSSFHKCNKLYTITFHCTGVLGWVFWWKTYYNVALKKTSVKICTGKLLVERVSSSGNQLFKYMMDHKKVYHVRTIEMHGQAPFETVSAPHYCNATIKCFVIWQKNFFHH